jgi:hypothetical protein
MSNNNNLIESARKFLYESDNSEYKKMAKAMIADGKKNGKSPYNEIIEETPSYLEISYRGNMGSSIERSVDPILKSNKIPSIEELKRKFPNFAESGSPSYSWSIIFKKPKAEFLYLSPAIDYNMVIDSIADDLSTKTKDLFAKWSAQNRAEVSNAASKKYGAPERLLTAINTASKK